MFKKLFGGKGDASPNPESGPQLGMLALRSGKGLSASKIVQAWATLFPNVPPLTDEGSSKKGGGAVAQFDTGGRSVMLAAMPMPIPQKEIDEAAERSWMWPEAPAEVKKQTAHAIALTTPGGEPVAEAWAVTRLLAAAAKAGDSVGIYWGNGGQVHKPDTFISMAQSCGEEEGMLPVMLWIGVLVSGKGPKGPFTLTTHGMNQFGHKDLEIINTKMPPGELTPTVCDVINYLLNSGPVFKHGQTFGPTPTDKWKIEHAQSQFKEGEGVIRLHVP